MRSRLSIRVRMLLVLASVAIVSAGVTSLISYLTARRAIEHQAFESLVAAREMKANQIEDYVGQITDQILTLAESRMIVDAMDDLRRGFDAIDDELALDPGEAERRDRRLRLYYQDQFVSRLGEVSGTVGLLGLRLRIVYKDLRALEVDAGLDERGVAVR